MNVWKNAAECADAMRELATVLSSSLERGGGSEDEQEHIARAMLQFARELVQMLGMDPRIGSEAILTLEHELRHVVESRKALAQNAIRYS